jgi:2-octaprenyl-6-methoxyphenol hydroxylase
MAVTDSKLENVVRPSFLTFGEEAEDGEPRAHIVEHRALIVALREAVAAEGVELLARPVQGFERESEFVSVSFGEHSRAAKLLVAADGARSKLRAQAKISSVAADYKQLGIVATIGHEREHKGVATQHFLPAGTFATLPLTGKRSSIVWAETADEARRLVALPPDQFKKELTRRFGLKLGEIEVLSKVRAFPLSLSIARSFTIERFALLGDAAHVIHPLAGQGLNLGLRDAAALGHCRDGGRNRWLEPAVLEPVRCLARAPRRGARRCRARTEAERIFHA